MITRIPKEKLELQRRLDAELEKFLADGGVIEQLPTTISVDISVSKKAFGKSGASRYRVVAKGVEL